MDDAVAVPLPRGLRKVDMRSGPAAAAAFPRGGRHKGRSCASCIPCGGPRDPIFQRPETETGTPFELELTLPPKVTPRAFARLAEINAGGPARPLRVAVAGGGCSGFQYDIRLDEAADDDLVLQGDGQAVVVDPVSLPFLAGATIDFADELIGARFTIENPNASSSCGCGTSFSI